LTASEDQPILVAVAHVEVHKRRIRDTQRNRR
jgi:hypothetical protein